VIAGHLGNQLIDGVAARCPDLADRPRDLGRKRRIGCGRLPDPG
jgi:hypothetical protein